MIGASGRPLVFPLIAALLGGAFVIGIAGPERAAADGSVEDELVGWMRHCSREGLRVRLEARPAGHLIVSITLNDSRALLVDITRAAPGSFVQAGAFGLSPMASYSDWRQAPAHEREAFERLLACVTRGGPGPPDPGSIEVPSPGTARLEKTRVSGWGAPWLLLAALLLTAGLLWREVSGTEVVERLPVALTAIGLVAGTFLFRWLLIEPAYFHQNGQGPLWMGYALGEPSTYGPGFGEVFGLLADLSPHEPESTVFLGQALLASLAPLCVLVISRAAGLAAPVAAALALALAIDPMWARLSFSESYFATTGSLALIAAALLAHGSARAGSHPKRFIIACLAAGCVAAQAARVHPYSWIPLSTLPLTALVIPGSVPERIRRALVSAFIIGAVAGLSVAPSTFSLFDESLSRWVSPLSIRLQYVSQYLPFALGAIVAMVVGAVFFDSKARLLGELALAAASVFAALLLLVANDLLNGDLEWVRQAYWRMALAVLVGPIAALFAVVASKRLAPLAAIALIASAVAFASIKWVPLTRLPTDALEAGLITNWRARLPEGSRIAYLGRLDKRVLILPFFGPDFGKVEIAGGDRSPTQLPAYDYYYRSSLCSTQEGRAACQRFERGQILEPIGEARLPARRSMPKMGYLAPQVRVGLYRVKRRW